MSDQLLYDILQKEIVRELLLEVDPQISDAMVDHIWSVCKGNPWNAPYLYKLRKMMEDQE
jgi:hypothetical protein